MATKTTTFTLSPAECKLLVDTMHMARDDYHHNAVAQLEATFVESAKRANDKADECDRLAAVFARGAS